MKKVLALLLTISMMMSFTGCTTPSDVSTNINRTTSQSVSSSITKLDSNQESSRNSSKESSTTSGENTIIRSTFSGELKVNFLDVGQGDSIFVELPNKETMLIDAGNDVNGNDIVSYIKNKGYATINYLVATHPHADHIGGMATVIQGLDVKTIYMPKATATTKTYENLLTTIQSKGLTIKSAKAGVSIINSDNLQLDIIAPNSETYENLNNYSAVLKLTYKDKSFLFMGDAETVSENEINTDIKADVLKVGHHGSNSSTPDSFLNKVSPNYAIISVGKGNTYGHPTDATLSKLNNANIQIYRTDEVGTVIVSTDGAKLTIDKKASSIKENAPPKAITSQEVTSDATGGKSYDDTPIATESYIGNKNTNKFHLPSCGSLPAMKNQIILKTRDEAINNGYVPCKRCNP